MAAAPFVKALLLLLFVSCHGDDSILCTEQFCRDYSFDVGCGAVVQHCQINNATHSGLHLPSPTTCNCCNYCLPFILEGESCTIGGSGDGINVARCGPGLTCTAGDTGSRCVRMESPCHSSQDDHDTRQALGAVGFLEERPKCDGKANYSPAICTPTQTCFCQSEDGERLFGELEYRDSNTLLRMQCGCSRRNHYIQKYIASFLDLPVIGPRCSQDGGYMPYQCDDRTCFCVDTITGNRVGSQTIDLGVQPLEDLTCYDASIDLFASLNSGDDTTNVFNYTSPCELEQKERAQFIRESKEDGFIVDYYTSVPQCLPDGTYGRIRKDVNGRKTCVTENNDQIEDYSIIPETVGYEEMNCKCAVTAYLLRGRIERPVCCSNGNFRAIQCRRGQCYCVDTDGRQIGVESSDVATLACYTDFWRSC